MKLTTENYRPDIIDARMGELYITDSITIDRKTLDQDGEGEFVGVAAFYDRENSNKRTYRPGCFEKSIRKNNKIVMLWDHSSASIIGRWLKFDDAGSRLLAHGRLSLGATAGRDAYELVRDGAVDGLSVGWLPYLNRKGEITGVDYNDDTGKCTVHEANLIETSIVAFPAADSARIKRINSADLRDVATVRELEKYLRKKLDMSKIEAKSLISHCMIICDQKQAGGLQDVEIIKENNQEKLIQKSTLQIIDSALAEMFGSASGGTNVTPYGGPNQNYNGWQL